MNYYKVGVKCGHVGRKCYINKYLYIKAESGKDAALKARNTPRVKHDWKNAINSVELISKNEYLSGLVQQSQDLYFSVTNSSEQRLLGAVDDEQVIRCEQIEKKKKDKDFMFYNKMAKIQQKDIKMQFNDCFEVEVIYG